MPRKMHHLDGKNNSQKYRNGMKISKLLGFLHVYGDECAIEWNCTNKYTAIGTQQKESIFGNGPWTLSMRAGNAILANAAKGEKLPPGFSFQNLWKQAQKSNGYTTPVHTTLTAFSAIPIEQWVSNLTTEGQSCEMPKDNTQEPRKLLV